MIISDLVKIGVGMSQGRKARRLAQTPRPAYEIPASAQKLLKATQFEAGNYGLPGQGQIENNLARQTATANNAILRAGQSPAAMIAGLSATDFNTKSTLGDLGVAGAQYRDQKQGQYYDALNQMAGYEQQQWQMDKLNPYLQDMAASSALQNASLQNQMSGLEGLEGSATQLAFLFGGAGKGKNTNPAGTGMPINNTGAGGFGGMSPMNKSFDYNSITNDDWLMYGDRMKQMFPGIDDELLKEQLPMFKKNYLIALSGNGG